VVVVVDVAVSVDVFVVVAGVNHSGHDHGYDHDLPRLSRDYGRRSSLTAFVPAPRVTRIYDIVAPRR